MKGAMPMPRPVPRADWVKTCLNPDCGSVDLTLNPNPKKSSNAVVLCNACKMKFEVLSV